MRLFFLGERICAREKRKKAPSDFFRVPFVVDIDAIKA